MSRGWQSFLVIHRLAVSTLLALAGMVFRVKAQTTLAPWHQESKI